MPIRIGRLAYEKTEDTSEMRSNNRQTLLHLTIRCISNNIECHIHDFTDMLLPCTALGITRRTNQSDRHAHFLLFYFFFFHGAIFFSFLIINIILLNSQFFFF